MKLKKKKKKKEKKRTEEEENFKPLIFSIIVMARLKAN